MYSSKLICAVTTFIVFSISVCCRENPKNGLAGGLKNPNDKTSHSPAAIKQSNWDKKSESGYNPKQNDNIECSEVDANCIEYCDLNEKCKYGENVTRKCVAKSECKCKGNKEFEREIVCQYCYQTAYWEHICNSVKGCNSLGAPRSFYQANCTVSPKIICLGSRTFSRNIPCKWQNGYRWSTTFLLSVTLGGFGADRFYLGRWQEGIGKLFSFGGLGVWTIVDIILIGVRYLGPGDGSLYVD